MARYETAPYRVVAKDGPYELRAYDGFHTATIDSSSWQGSGGFSQIFQYISGSNETSEKISMTTPVLNEIAPGQSTTEFVMPASYNEKTLPEPSDPSIRIRYHQPCLAAVIRFSGSVNDEKIEKNRILLSNWIQRKGMETLGALRLARYNPPFIPPFLRRNELLLDVAEMIGSEDGSVETPHIR